MESDKYCRDVVLQPIGVIHSCFSEKFAIPRQPGMVPAATAVLELWSPWNRHEMVRGLEQFSHLWVHFLFHERFARNYLFLQESVLQKRTTSPLVASVSFPWGVDQKAGFSSDIQNH